MSLFLQVLWDTVYLWHQSRALVSLKNRHQSLHLFPPQVLLHIRFNKIFPSNTEQLINVRVQVHQDVAILQILTLNCENSARVRILLSFCCYGYNHYYAVSLWQNYRAIISIPISQFRALSCWNVTTLWHVRCASLVPSQQVYRSTGPVFKPPSDLKLISPSVLSISVEKKTWGGGYGQP